MPSFVEKPTMTVLSCCLQEGQEEAFHEWQARLNTAASISPGFISSEVSFAPSAQAEWMIVQRFQTPEALKIWETSADYQSAVKDLETHALKGSIRQGSSDIQSLQNGVTEIFVTEVSPGKESEFQKWNAQINQVEAQFPGFRGAYLQSPGSVNETHWITMIRFDSTDNLDRWLASNERKEMIGTLKTLISSIEGHRMASPYPGWFASASKIGQKPPPGWKQGIIVLLVLYPIVMIELNTLGFLANYMNLSLRTFIANAISVALLTYPLIPLGIHYLKWWLSPPDDKKVEYTVKGCLIIAGIFALEIAICIWMFK